MGLHIFIRTYRPSDEIPVPLEGVIIPGEGQNQIVENAFRKVGTSSHGSRLKLTDDRPYVPALSIVKLVHINDGELVLVLRRREASGLSSTLRS